MQIKSKNKGSEYMKCEKCSKCESCEKSTHRTEEEKKSLTKRLNIIEGQIRGIKQMIEDDRYCAATVSYTHLTLPTIASV